MADGRLIAFPSSGWTADAWVDGRLVAYPTTASEFEIPVTDKTLLARLAVLQGMLPEDVFRQYVLFCYVNEIASDTASDDWRRGRDAGHGHRGAFLRPTRAISGGATSSLRGKCQRRGLRAGTHARSGRGFSLFSTPPGTPWRGRG